MSEIVSNLNYAHDLNICETVNQVSRVPFLETRNPVDGTPVMGKIVEIPPTTRRLIKSHLQPSFFHASLWESKVKVGYEYL